MKYLLDTNACIVHLRGKDANLMSRLAATASAEVAWCSVVKAELRYGAERSANPTSSHAQHSGVQPGSRFAVRRLANDLRDCGMAKQKTAAKLQSTGKKSSDFMEVGQEVVPGMRLRCICRGHQGTIGHIAWSPCGRFIASPPEDKTIRIWDANDATASP